MAYSFAFSGPINTPPRSSFAAAAIVISVVAALSLAMVLPGVMGKWALVALTLLLPLAVVWRVVYAVHIALLALAWISLVGFVPFLRPWPLYILAPLAVYGVVVVLSPSLRRSVGWLRAGRSGRDIRILIIATVAVSGVALVAWAALTNPDIEHHLASVPALPLWVYPLVAVAFAVVNAAIEEVIFRGVMMEALDSALGDGYWSIGTQAVSFAALHYLSGFPSGVLGFFMVWVYGIMLGMIRRRSKGLLAPWVAHVAADITIFVILAVVLFRGGSVPLWR